MGGACSKRRPKYKQKVLAIYADKGTIKDLVQYAKQNPRTWPDIGRYLLKQLRGQVEKQQRAQVEVSMECFNKMLLGDEADLENYLDHVIHAIFLMFDQGPGHDFFYLLLGMKLLSTLMPLSHRQLKPAKIDRFFAELIKLPTYRPTQRLAMVGLVTLRKLITHSDDRRIASHLSSIIPLVLQNMDPEAHGGSGEASEHDEKNDIRTMERDISDQHNPHSHSERCWEAICDKVKDLMTLRELLRAFFGYARRQQWEPRRFLLSLLRTVQRNACTTASVGLKPSTLVQETLNELKDEPDPNARTTIMYLAGELGLAIQTKEPNCELETLLRAVRDPLWNDEDCTEELAAEGRNTIIKLCNRLPARDGLLALQEITAALRPGGPGGPLRKNAEPPPAVKQMLLEAAADVAAARERINPQAMPEVQGTISSILRNVLQCQHQQLRLWPEVVQLCQQVLANLLLTPERDRRRRRWDHAPLAERVAEKLAYFTECLEENFERLLHEPAARESPRPEEHIQTVAPSIIQAQQRKWLYAAIYQDLTAHQDPAETIRLYWLTMTMALLAGGLEEDLPVLLPWCMQLQGEASALQKSDNPSKIEHGATLHTFALSLLTVAARMAGPGGPAAACLEDLEEVRAQRHANGEHSSRVLIGERTGLLNLCLEDDDVRATPITVLVQEEMLRPLLPVGRQDSNRLLDATEDEKEEKQDMVQPAGIGTYDPKLDLELLMAEEQDNASSITRQTESLFPTTGRWSHSSRHHTPDPPDRDLDLGSEEVGHLQNARDFDALANAADRQCTEPALRVDKFLASLEFSTAYAGPSNAQLTSVPGMLSAGEPRDIDELVAHLAAGIEDEREMLVDGCPTLDELLQTDSDTSMGEGDRGPQPREGSKRGGIRGKLNKAFGEVKKAGQKGAQAVEKAFKQFGQKMTRHRKDSASHDTRREPDGHGGIELVDRAADTRPINV